jgi:hypothetical protein
MAKTDKYSEWFRERGSASSTWMILRDFRSGVKQLSDISIPYRGKGQKKERR